MKEVPLLPSWWHALAATELIEVKGTRVVAGPSAIEWTAESTPPVELAEALVGMTVCEYILEDLANRSAHFADQVAAVTIARLLLALNPERDAPSPVVEDEFDRLLDAKATRDLQRLERVGVLARDATGAFVVPRALRGAVAGGLVTALALISGAFESD